MCDVCKSWDAGYDLGLNLGLQCKELKSKSENELNSEERDVLMRCLLRETQIKASMGTCERDSLSKLIHDCT